MKKIMYIPFILSVSIINLNCGATKQPIASQIEQKKNKQTVNTSYKIVSKNDLSFYKGGRTIKRTEYRVSIVKTLKEDELKTMSKEIIENLIQIESQNAVSILYYLPNTNTNGFYTAGKVDWAPYGIWGKSDEVLKGDYSKHDYRISIGGVMGKVVEPTNTIISENKRKEIFYNLIKLQDTGVDGKISYDVIAGRYNVDVKLVKDIVMEGLTKNWKMP